MSISLDRQPYRPWRRWPRHVIEIAAALWEEGAAVKIIARRMTASGVVISPRQIYSIARVYSFPRRTHHNAETVAQIRKLWGDGYSAGRIGKSLALTRGQVMGVVHNRGFERKTDVRFTLNDLDEE
jgi:hypothetical protein